MYINDLKQPFKTKNFTLLNVTVTRGGDCFLLIADDTAILFDSGFGFSAKKQYEKIKEVLANKSLDYIFLTHSHYDHALGSAYISQMYPDCKVVASSYAAHVFTRDGAKKTMERLDRIEASNKGYTDYNFNFDDLHCDIPVDDGTIFMAGSHKVEVIALPGHTKDSFAYRLTDDELILGCETIGMLVSDNKVMPSFLVGYEMSMNSIDKISKYKPDYFLIPHQGLLDSEGFNSYVNLSHESHIAGKDLIMDAYKKGCTNEEIIDIFAKEYYTEESREIYPEAAFMENINIQIPLIIKEMISEI